MRMFGIPRTLCTMVEKCDVAADDFPGTVFVAKLFPLKLLRKGQTDMYLFPRETLRWKCLPEI